MTVETTTRKQTFAGGQQSLDFTFRTLVDHPEYTSLLVREVATGEETVLTYDVDYSVAVNADGVGGTVTVSPTYSTAYNYVVYRETVTIQASDYDDYNQFPADTLEEDLDRAILIAQEQEEFASRTLRFPISAAAIDNELPEPEAETFLGWNDAGDALENKTLPDPSTLVKATQAQAEAATNNTVYMTPLRVAQEVQKAGALSIPIANFNVSGVTNSTTFLRGDSTWAVPVTASTLTIASIVNTIYPVGSIYISTVSTEPATLFGVGTWVTWGGGRVIVGYLDLDPDFGTSEGTGGASSFSLTSSADPSYSNITESGAVQVTSHPHTHTVSGSTLQPYIVAFMWKRTA